RAKNSAPINSAMLIKARVLAGKQGIDKKRRNLIERNFQPVRSGEAAVNFSVDIKNRIAFRHLADFLRVECRGPAGVKKKHSETGRRDQSKQRELPAVTEEFALSGASEEFHRRKVKKVKRVTRLKRFNRFDSLTSQ